MHISEGFFNLTPKLTINTFSTACQRMSKQSHGELLFQGRTHIGRYWYNIDLAEEVATQLAQLIACS